ncbi:MAG: transposase [Acidobacteriia bacterium]|nr:transposase [Terriglobia bacterium]
MRNRELLKQILEATRDLWDRPETRPDVRENFARMLNCRTAALGAEVYASPTGEKTIFYHTCKSRACPSCGYRATLLWQEEMRALLPDIRYAGVGFTMPNVLWPIFKQNRHLLHDLPALGAEVIQQWVNAKYGARVLIIVVQHTFGASLNFNCHLHILVSAGGLQESQGRWISRIHFPKVPLMRMWKYVVITYLREAIKTNVLRSDFDAKELRKMLKTQYERDFWIVDVDHCKSKQHFLGYAARYVRRPPIAQRRFVKVTEREVQFLTKDKKLQQVVTTRYSIEQFIALWAQHVPDRYRHAIRYFGLLAPSTKSRTWAALFVLLGQERRPRPQRLSWRNSLRQYFGVDPLVDRNGQPMKWARRQTTVARRSPVISLS